MLIVSFSDAFCIFNQYLSLPNGKQGKLWLRLTKTIFKKFNLTVQKEVQKFALWQQHKCLYDVSSAPKNAAVAKRCLSIDFIIVKN